MKTRVIAVMVIAILTASTLVVSAAPAVINGCYRSTVLADIVGSVTSRSLVCSTAEQVKEMEVIIGSTL